MTKFLVLAKSRLSIFMVAGFFYFWLASVARNEERTGMVVIVTSKTLHVTQALREMAERQAQKLYRLGKRIISVRVSLEAVAKKKNDTHATIVQYHVELPGKNVVVKRKARDMYEALVDAASSAARQVRKSKEKRMTFKRGYKSMFPSWQISKLPLET